MITQLELFPNLPVVRNPTGYWSRYGNYMRSPEWQFVRRQTFALADYRCEARKPGCTSDAEQCHHLNYLHWWSPGGDRPGVDTMAVCGNCHRWIHAHPPANDNFPIRRTGDTR